MYGDMEILESCSASDMNAKDEIMLIKNVDSIFGKCVKYGEHLRLSIELVQLRYNYV